MKKKIYYKVCLIKNNNQNIRYVSMYIGTKIPGAEKEYIIGETTKRNKDEGGLCCFRTLNEAKCVVQYFPFDKYCILSCHIDEEIKLDLYVSNWHYNDAKASKADRSFIGINIVPIGTVCCNEITPIKLIQKRMSLYS